MSKKSGASSSYSSSRVSSWIPNNVRKTIDQIKEITGGNHTEDDIYAMLKDCSMDPNETAQRLLHLGTFHEVKRKRDKKKEAVKSTSGGESRWKSGHQGRGTRSFRGHSFSQYSSNDSGGRRTGAIHKDNGVEESRDEGFRHSHGLVSKDADPIKSRDREKPSSIIKNGPLELPNGSLNGGLGVQLSKVDVSADNESKFSGGAIKKEVQVQKGTETSSLVPANVGIGTTDFVRDNLVNKSEVESVDCSLLSSSSKKQVEVVKGAHPEIPGEGAHSVTVIKPSSPQGVKDATAKLEKLKFSGGQHVIIPQHIQVPDSVKNVLSFGSLDPRVRETCVNNKSNESSEHVVDRAPLDTVSDLYPCDQDAISTGLRANHADDPPSSLCLPSQQSPVNIEVTSSATVPKDDQPKQENIAAVGPPPFPVVQTTPTYGFGFLPPMVASVLGQPEGFESQALVGGASTSTPPPPTVSTVGTSPQPIHVIRQQYPPNYIPYSHYFSPFYVPPTMHQYFGHTHTAFTPPLPTTTMYLPPPTPTTSPCLKISASNFKPGSNVGIQAPLGVPSVYGSYGPSVAYFQNATVTPAISTTAQDIVVPALKESNIYLGQQSEGSAVWPTSGVGREAASLPFINIGPHGPQHLLNPHSGHGGFAVYHTLQPMGSPAPGLPLLQQSQPVPGSIESVGPPPNFYQHSQRQQPIN